MNSIAHQFFILFVISVSLLFSEQKSTTEIQSSIDDQSQELNKLRQQIEEIEKRISSRKNEAEDIKDMLRQLDSKIRLTEKLIRSLNNEEYILSARILEATENIKINRGKLYTLRDNLTHQVQYLYKHGRTKLIEDLLTTQDLNSFYYKRKYLDVITRHQQNISTQIDTIIYNLEAQKEEMNENLSRKKNIRNEKEKEINNLADDKKLRSKYLKKVKKDTENLTDKLDEQKQLAEQVEKLIQILISDKEKAKQREKELVKRRKNKSQLGEKYFASMKGKLDWPVSGKIISKFGPNYNEKTKTWSENPGIDIKADGGTTIYPVLDGLITTITFLRGYGNIIIIDHGGNYYSVYGNLKNIAVTENEYVDESMKLAIIAEQIEMDSSLHFEVWGNSKQLNPEDWLK